MGNGEPQRGRTAVLIGGAALLMWLLLRGPGWRLGRGRASGDGADTTRQPAGRPCRVHIDAAGIAQSVRIALGLSSSEASLLL